MSITLLLALSTLVPPAQPEPAPQPVRDPRVELVEQLEDVVRKLRRETEATADKRFGRVKGQEDQYVLTLVKLYLSLHREQKSWAVLDLVDFKHNQVSILCQMATEFARQNREQAAFRAMEQATKVAEECDEWQRGQLPDLNQTWSSMASYFREAQNHSAAAVCSSKFKRTPATWTMLQARAEEAAEKSRREVSRKLARQALSLMESQKAEPDEDWYSNHALVCLLAGEDEKALKSLENLVALSHGFPDLEKLRPLTKPFRLLGKLGEFDKAEIWLAQLRIYSFHARQQVRWAIVFEQASQGDLETVMPLLRKRAFSDQEQHDDLCRAAMWSALEQKNEPLAQEITLLIRNSRTRFWVCLVVAESCATHRPSIAREMLRHAETVVQERASRQGADTVPNFSQLAQLARLFNLIGDQIAAEKCLTQAISNAKRHAGSLGRAVFPLDYPVSKIVIACQEFGAPDRARVLLDELWNAIIEQLLVPKGHWMSPPGPIGNLAPPMFGLEFRQIPPRVEHPAFVIAAQYVKLGLDDLALSRLESLEPVLRDRNPAYDLIAWEQGRLGQKPQIPDWILKLPTSRRKAELMSLFLEARIHYR